MRKHLIRWWYKSTWPQDRTMQAIREWNEKEWPASLTYAERHLDFVELWDVFAVSLHRLRHHIPYTGSGDLFDPYTSPHIVERLDADRVPLTSD